MSLPTPEPPGPEPTPPRPQECCGTACDPCIWTYYHRSVEKWKARVEAWEQHCRNSPEDPS